MELIPFFSVLDDLKGCIVSSRESVSPPLSRVCPRHQFISCRCSGGEIFKDHVHNACVGRGPSTTALKLHPVWNSQAKFMFAGVHLDPCYTYTIDEFGRWKHDEQGHDLKETHIIMKVTPFFRETETSSKKEDILSTGQDEMEERNVPEEESEQNLESKDLEYRVEISNTLEKQLRCVSLKNHLSDCHLEECVDGAILADHTSSPAHFGGRSCVVPVLASVHQSAEHFHVPKCTCGRIVAAFSKLQVWTTRKALSGSQCLIIISAIHKETQFTYWLVNLVTNSVKERLQNAVSGSEKICANDTNMETIELCFYTQETANMAYRGSKSDLCWTLSLEAKEKNFRDNIFARGRMENESTASRLHHSIWFIFVVLCFCILV
ncbi:hypothetical protein PoB_005553000 [Plakobranchus ocellatus]|uniref:Uncharacterized protein n=1 Tax=Plakobranchus ocellatus TaxID=259542 RepID=A0AAV4CC72_9GAST|nr:hypothetical protein PoB_005553000 [Plakobranchus ocellatus]